MNEQLLPSKALKSPATLKLFIYDIIVFTKYPSSRLMIATENNNIFFFSFVVKVFHRVVLQAGRGQVLVNSVLQYSKTEPDLMVVSAEGDLIPTHRSTNSLLLLISSAAGFFLRFKRTVSGE
jgi:hypothetical protein